MKVDLHLHSTASDGTLAPGELARMAAAEGFDLIALTDHDSVDGVHEARLAGEAADVRVIPGVELSCGAQKEIHVLGYGVDPKNAALLDFCLARRENRVARTEQMVERLAENGVVVSMERIRELARGVMGRPHVARAIVEAGFAASTQDAFEKYLLPGKCGYVPKEDVKVADAVRLIDEAGGVAVLAHPMELKMGEMALEAVVREWKTAGLAGLEAWHPSAAGNKAEYLDRLARREGMLITGGSDFHGPVVRNSRIGEGLERWRTMEPDARALLLAIDKGNRQAKFED